MVAAAALAGTAAATTTAAPAAAHVPFLEPDRSSAAPAVRGDPFPGAVPVPDAAISRAVYGTLAHDAPFDAYHLSVSRTAVTPIEMLVPAAGRYRDFRPSFALVGPGLTPSGTPPPFLQQRLLEAYGGILFVRGMQPGTMVVDDPGLTPRPTFYEPFSFTTYFRGAKTTVTLQPHRTYYLIAYDPAGRTGAYALGIGVAEKFSVGDAFRSVVDVVRIKLGLYGQGAFDPVAAAILAAIVAAVVLLAVWLGRRRRRRRRAARAFKEA